MVIARNVQKHENDQKERRERLHFLKLKDLDW